MNDAELLRDFVERRSDSAFAEIVKRHINLVYSTALRMVRDSALAQDVAQSVFVELARKASSIRDGNALPGWLYRATRFQSANVVRAEQTRRRHETEAMMQANLQTDDAWEQIRSEIEEAMEALDPADQNLVLMRFFENQNWRDVSSALALSEDTAQRRVDRALEKLRTYYARKGVAVSASVIGLAVATHAVQAAPVGLASSVSVASLAGVATGQSVSLLTLIKSMLMKKTAYALLFLAIVAGISVPVMRARSDKTPHPASANSLKEGLILHMNFDQDAAGVVTDTSGLGNHGKVSGAHWTADGKQGGAYEFSADGDQIVIANNKSLNPETLTLAAWVKTSTADATWRRVFDKSYTKGFALSIAGDWQKNKWRGLGSIEMGPGTHFALTKTMIADGHWHHLAVTFDGSAETFYVDGRGEARILWNKHSRLGSTDFDLVIGCNRSNLKEDDLGTSFRGTIDEPMLWNRALTADEVKLLYESQNQATVSSAAAN